MAELKLWQRVNNITGQSSKSRYLVPFINNASKWLINSLPEKFLWSVASTTELDGTQNGLVGYEGGASTVGTGSGIDKRVDMILTEAGFEWKMPEAHAVWK